MLPEIVMHFLKRGRIDRRIRACGAVAAFTAQNRDGDVVFIASLCRRAKDDVARGQSAGLIVVSRDAQARRYDKHSLGRIQRHRSCCLRGVNLA
jgi:hypothetical protein